MKRRLRVLNIRLAKWFAAVLVTLAIVGLQLFFRTILPPRTDTRTLTSLTPTIQKEKLNNDMAVVARVVDGDTIELTDKRKVRYIGIDTPETVDPKRPIACFGKEATEENKRLVLGKTVRLEKDISDTDTFGRLLRYVYVGDVFINEAMVANGFAYVSTYPPDIQYQDTFLLAQTLARSQKKGLWESCPSTVVDRGQNQ